MFVKLRQTGFLHLCLLQTLSKELRELIAVKDTCKVVCSDFEHEYIFCREKRKQEGNVNEI